MKKLNVVDLRSKLKELQNEEIVAKTREKILIEEKQQLLSEIQTLFIDLEKLNLFTKEELVPGNLQSVLDKLYSHVETEIFQCKIPEV